MNHTDPRPLVLHIIHRFDFGGLENGLVNLVNHMPVDRFRHHILALTDVSSIASRIAVDHAVASALGKREGKDLSAYWRLFRQIRALAPAVVHTRNVGTLDCQVLAWLAGVPRRIHGEHGWDIFDPDGTHPKFRRRRRILFRLVHRLVPLSEELERYLLGLDPAYRNRITRICNGVDLDRFPAQPVYRSPRNSGGDSGGDSGGAGGAPVFGSVTRFSDIKAPLNTIRAFAAVRARAPCRLVMVGDGPLLGDARALATELGVGRDVEFAGAQLDVVPWLAKMDVFVLSSLREGISNTVLEAMAAGRPVVASKVGGNTELIVPDETGYLVEPGNVGHIEQAMGRYVNAAGLIERQGRAARARARSCYSLDGMVNAYTDLYQAEIERAPGRAAH